MGFWEQMHENFCTYDYQYIKQKVMEVWWVLRLLKGLLKKRIKSG